MTDLHLTPTLSDLDEGASTQKIYDLISATADAYQEAAIHASSSGSAAYHARFLRSLVAKDMATKARQAVRERKVKDNSDAMSVGGTSQGTPSQASPSYTGEPSNAPPSYHPPLAPGALPVQTPPAVGGAGMPNGNGLMYQQQPMYTDDMFPFPSSPHLPVHPAAPQQVNEHNQEMQQQHPYVNGMQMQQQSHQQSHQQMMSQHQQHQQQQQQQQQQHQGNNQQYAHNMYANMQTTAATASDQHYWRNMFIELGK